MSRIGKKPIEIPKGIEVKIGADQVSVKGPKGTLTQDLVNGIKVTVADGRVVVERAADTKQLKSSHGLIRALINNMINGVNKGFDINLELVGVGYKAVKQGKDLKLQIGFSHSVDITPPQGIEIEVEGQNKIKVTGADRQLVGQVAANIRRVRPPEPYKGKGIRYVNEIVRKKAGKVAKVGGGAAAA
jgi:large subunit ribosomal protein L6